MCIRDSGNSEAKVEKTNAEEAAVAGD